MHIRLFYLNYAPDPAKNGGKAKTKQTDFTVVPNATTGCTAQLLFVFRKFLLLLVLTCCVAGIAAAQSSQPNPALKTRVRPLLDRARMTYITDSSVLYAEQALAIAKDGGDRSLEMEAWYQLGRTYSARSEYDQANDALNKGSLIAFAEDDPYWKGLFFLEVGKINQLMEKHKTALNYYMSGLDFLNESKNKEGVLRANIYLAEYYRNLAKFGIAEQYIHTAFADTAGIRPDKLLIISLYNRAAAICSETGKTDSSKYYSTLALNLSREIGHRHYEAVSLNEIAFLIEGQGKFNEALKNYEEAEKIWHETHYPRNWANARLNRARVLAKMNQRAESIRLLEELVKEGEKNSWTSVLVSAYNLLSEDYYFIGKYKESIDYRTKHYDLSLKLFVEENQKDIEDIKTKYETEQKEKEIALLNKDKILRDVELQKREAEVRQQRTFINAFILGFVLVGIFSVLLVRAYRQKQKTNRMLAIQKLEIEEQKEQLEQKNKDITDSINYAKRIQRASLPSRNYLKKHLAEHFVFYKPKDILSGDFYWAIETEQGEQLIATADCMGHGVPGACMSLIGTSLLNEIVLGKKVTRPDLVLLHLREGLTKALNPEDAELISEESMDIVLYNIDADRTTLKVAAANNPLWLVREGHLVEVKPDKFPVGSHIDHIQPYTLNTLSLSKGDMIYTFTDGYADQFGGPKGKKFKYKQLQQLLMKISSLAIEEQRKIIKDTLDSWKGNLEQVDDILVIGIRM